MVEDTGQFAPVEADPLPLADPDTAVTDNDNTEMPAQPNASGFVPRANAHTSADLQGLSTSVKKDASKDFSAKELQSLKNRSIGTLEPTRQEPSS